MKKLWLILIISTLSFSVRGQFSKGTLQATGLTCAMCSNAVNKALQKVASVAVVRSDIKNSSFNITFKENVEIDIDALKRAVEDAGFSVGSLKLTGRFNQVTIAKDEHIKIGNSQFHFLNVEKQVLNGERILTIVDKDFLTARDFKKVSSSTTLECIQTGKASTCCIKDGIPANTRIYHVTI
ncbi:MAG TPA: heavy-metal-associated domain-containing protein [Chitinophagaceae bacterium]|nr:heavy-metal-associated domain-containing protein [Chitinophagaceae bacterium]